MLTHKAKKKHIFILVTFTKKRFKLTCKRDKRAYIAWRKDRHRKAIISIAKFEKERKYKINFNFWISVNWTSYSKYYFETSYAWASLKRACLVKSFRDYHLNREKENYIYVLLILVKKKPMKICIQEKQMSFSRFIIDIIIWMGNIK